MPDVTSSAKDFFPHLGPNAIAFINSLVDLWLNTDLGMKAVAACGSRDDARGGVFLMLREGSMIIKRSHDDPNGPVTNDTKFSLELTALGHAQGQAYNRAHGEAGA